MYEKTIGRHNLIYSINAPTHLSIVETLLDPADLAELDSILLKEREQRHVVDGYLKCTGGMWIAHKEDGIEEEVLANERYPLPIYNWHKFVYVRGVGQILVRLITS